MYRIDGIDLCTPCLLDGGYKIADAVLLGSPFAMAAAAGVGVANVTIHAKDPKEFLANGGVALVNAVVKHALRHQPQERDEGLIERTFALQTATQEETTMKEFIDLCKADGCNQGLTKANKSGYCAKIST